MKDQMGLHNSNKLPFFEGYYYKVVTNEFSLAIIIGFSIDNNQKNAFIQCYNTLNHKKEYLSYDFMDFNYDILTDTVSIKNSYFNKNEVYLNDDRLDHIIHYTLENHKKIEANLYAPTIMGPFYYLPFMQCNHAVISVESDVVGSITYDDKTIIISGIGYIEKDWGSSFPNEYIWLQSNHCIQNKANLFLACGHIPIIFTEFIGTIGVINIEDKTYKLGTYYGAKVIERSVFDDINSVIIKQGKYLFTFKIKQGTTCDFKGPVDGKMVKRINESLDSTCLLKIYKKGILKHELTFTKCGNEIIDFMK